MLPTGPGQRRALDPVGLTDLTGGAWLPDGSSVVFSASDSNGGSRLYVQAVDGGTPRPVGPDRTRILPAGAVSPDARFVVGIRGSEFLLVPIDGKGEARVVPGVARPADRVAQWTSDSRALYVYQTAESGLTVSLLDLQTGRRRPWREIQPLTSTRVPPSSWRQTAGRGRTLARACSPRSTWSRGFAETDEARGAG